VKSFAADPEKLFALRHRWLRRNPAPVPPPLPKGWKDIFETHGRALLEWSGWSESDGVALMTAIAWLQKSRLPWLSPFTHGALRTDHGPAILDFVLEEQSLVVIDPSRIARCRAQRTLARQSRIPSPIHQLQTDHLDLHPELRGLARRLRGYRIPHYFRNRYADLGE